MQKAARILILHRKAERFIKNILLVLVFIVAERHRVRHAWRRQKDIVKCANLFIMVIHNLLDLLMLIFLGMAFASRRLRASPAIVAAAT